MQSLAERVLSHIRRQDLLRAGDRVGVAVSGGIDSVALLRLLLELRGELGIVLSVVHFNHKLRGTESEADQSFVADLAHRHGLEFCADSDDVAQHAVEESISVEAAARELRYGFFRHLLGEDREGDAQTLKPDSIAEPTGATGSRTLSNQTSGLDKIVTGHTLDDQAETVLMRMIRGAGLRGLGGIHPRIAVEDDDGNLRGEIVRPLLAFRHRGLERYLNELGQSWREDSTNAEDHFTRNRVRKLIVPLLETEFNPAVAENLAELAEIARGEEDYWENEVAGWMGTAVHWLEPPWVPTQSPASGLVRINLAGGVGKTGSVQDQPPGDTGLQAKINSAPWLVMNASVDRGWFLSEPVAVQRRVVKAIGEHAGISLEFKHVEAILRLAGGDGDQEHELSLPLGWRVTRNREELLFLTPDLTACQGPVDYQYELPIPGQVQVNEAGSQIALRRVPAGSLEGYNPDHLLDADSVPGPLRVRNWRPGDRFWPAHTKSPKKIKELLQERHIGQFQRRLWPVIEAGDEIVWVRSFPASARFRAKPGRDAILIAEKPLDGNSVT